MAYAPGSLYFYRPSLPAAILFSAIFLFLAIGFLLRITRRPYTWRLSSPAVLCCIELVAAFILRCVAHYHYTDTSVGLFIAEEITVQIAPPVLALGLYLTLARALYYIPYHSPIHPARVRTTFVGLDAVVGAVMGAGAARFGNTGLDAQQRSVGEALVRTGMVLQCVLMVGFITLCSVFYTRCRRSGLDGHVRKVMICLFACAACILVRSVYRTVEFFQGYLGTLYTHEAFFYCLDIIWVLLAMAIFLAIYPPSHLPKSHKTFLALDGRTEREGPGWDDSRHWVITLFDPCDLAGVCTGRDKRTRFWEEEDSCPPVKEVGVEKGTDGHGVAV